MAMTTAATEKRLAKIEIQLTPKEWAIRLADEFCQYPTSMEFLRAMVKQTREECLVMRAFDALRKQAAERYPGTKPEDVRLRNQRYEVLRNEYHTLKVLLKHAENAVAQQIDPLSLRAALKFSQLRTLILQEAIGQSADGNTIPGGISGEHLTPMLTDWAQDAITLVSDAFALPAAIQLVQDQHFDGHPILFREWEARMMDVVNVVEDGIAAYNQYVQTRTPPVDTKEGAQSPASLAIDLAALNATAKAGAALAAKWFKESQDEATDDYESLTGDEWSCRQNRIRELVGEQS